MAENAAWGRCPDQGLVRNWPRCAQGRGLGGHSLGRVLFSFGSPVYRDTLPQRRSDSKFKVHGQRLLLKRSAAKCPCVCTSPCEEGCSITLLCRHEWHAVAVGEAAILLHKMHHHQSPPSPALEMPFFNFTLVSIDKQSRTDAECVVAPQVAWFTAHHPCFLPATWSTTREGSNKAGVGTSTLLCCSWSKKTVISYLLALQRRASVGHVER